MYPTFLFISPQNGVERRRKERSARDRQTDNFSFSFCLPFEITLRCHDIHLRVPPSLPPPSPLSSFLLATKSSSVSFVSIFTEFREDAHISRREARGGGRRARKEEKEEGPSRKKGKEMEFAFLSHRCSPSPPPQRGQSTFGD